MVRIYDKMDWTFLRATTKKGVRKSNYFHFIDVILHVLSDRSYLDYTHNRVCVWILLTHNRVVVWIILKYIPFKSNATPVRHWNLIQISTILKYVSSYASLLRCCHQTVHINISMNEAYKVNKTPPLMQGTNYKLSTEKLNSGSQLENVNTADLYGDLPVAMTCYKSFNLGCRQRII